MTTCVAPWHYGGCRVEQYIRSSGLQQEVVEVVVDQGREVRLRLAGGSRVGTGGLVVGVREALLQLHSLRTSLDSTDFGGLRGIRRCDLENPQQDNFEVYVLCILVV